MKTAFLHLILLLLFTSYASGQQTFSININRTSGLPSSTVYDFFQDSKGFIWIASNAGLTRYDGFEFITYTADHQTYLSGSAIQEDKYGRIWYQNFDGYLYYVKDEQLYSIQQNKPGEYVPGGIINDYLFIVQQTGVDIFNLKTLQYIRTVKVNAKNIISSTVLGNAFYFVSDNTVFKIGTDFQLEQTNYFINKNIKVNRINNDGNHLFLVYKNTDIHTLYFLNKDLSFSHQTTFSSKGSILTDQYLNNRYWLYTNKGFFVHDKAGTLVMSNNDLKIDPSINKCIIDRHGNYWFSSLRNGIHLITDFSNKVYSFDQLDLLSGIENKNGFLFSTLKSQIIETDYNFNFKRKLVDLGESNHILNFQYDETNNLLFYTTSVGLHIYQGNKDVYFEDIAVKNILKLDEKYYAVTTSGYVMLLKNPVLKDENITSKWDKLYKKNKSDKFTNLAPLLSNLRSKSLDFYDDNSKIIVASNIGLFLFDTLGHSEFLIEGKHFFASDVYSYNKKIYLLDNIGNLYLVYRSGKSSRLNNELGIPANAIKLIKRFGNTLYLVCQNRIFEYDLTYSTSSIYSFNTNLLIVTDLIKTDDKLIIISGKQIITIDLNKKSIQSNHPQFYFNNFYVANEKVDLNTLSDLKNGQNTIRITYSLLDYGSNKEPKISYRLNKGEWVKLTAGSREIQLISLSPGEYVLEVKINETILEQNVQFKINFPFYMRWWFVLTILGTIITTGIFIYSWRMFSLRKKIKQLNEKIILENKLRSTMLTSIKAQMNPHFFYNALNTIQAYIFSNDKFHATSYLAKFSKLTRMILEMSGEISIKLEDELAALKLYLELEQMRFQSNFSFEINCDDSINIQTIRIPSIADSALCGKCRKARITPQKRRKTSNYSF